VKALRPSDLGGLFPEIIKDLATDSYYSINGLHQPWRKAKLVANLNAVWLDIDYHEDLRRRPPRWAWSRSWRWPRYGKFPSQPYM
jgi:hypothetical protein